jgi:hypothetical protein
MEAAMISEYPRGKATTFRRKEKSEGRASLKFLCFSSSRMVGFFIPAEKTNIVPPLLSLIFTF